MKTIKINTYSELEQFKKLNKKEFILDLKDCPANQTERIIDFMCGLTFLNGSMKKLNSCEYEIRIDK